jgi:16S rRNA (adenine1518-N6/adenine1519-N6)-dimethyltransferase
LASLILVAKWPPWYERLILMFQKEVAERIIAEKNTKEFGRLSVLCGWRMDIKKHFDVSKNCFLPKPKINSTILSFIPKKNINFKLKDPKILEKVTRILFSNRRKMINKNFLKLFKNNSSVADDLKIDLKKRPGELSKENYYNIAIKYEKLFC